jgi:hypothetical protein
MVLDAPLGVMVAFLLAEEGGLWLLLDGVDGHHFEHIWLEGEPRLNLFNPLPDRTLYPQPQIFPSWVQ